MVNRNKYQKELVATAYHEAGHVAMYLQCWMAFRNVTIIPEGNALGCVVSFRWSEKLLEKLNYGGLLTPRDEIFLKKHMMIFVAGAVAESKYLKKATPIYTDHEKCVELIFSVLGCGEKTASAYWNYITEEAKERLNNPYLWGYIQKLVEELLKMKTLSYKQCKELYLESYRKKIEAP